MKRDDVLIGGAWRPVSSTTDVVNPADGSVVGTTALATRHDVDAAVAAAGSALPAWSALAPGERAAHLDRLVEVLESDAERLVDLTVAEVGAPITTARRWHVHAALDVLRSAADHARLLADERRGSAVLLRRATGVAALVTPWNYPLFQLATKLGPALAAGCTVVHKPSELTPLSAYAVAEAALVAGLPAGVLNLVPGTGADVGAPLVAHTGVAVVSFTGSTEVGRQVAGAAVTNLARVSLELGGKSSSIVTDDVDLEHAVRATVESCMLNSGQTCSALTRLLVPADRLDDAVRIAGAHADAMVVGDPTDPGTELGPLVSAAQLERVDELVAAAVARGAHVGTRRTETPAVGHYRRPVVLSGLAPDDPASCEEIFGPVLVVHGTRDDDDAVTLANATRYGLSGAVWCDDDDRAFAIAARLQTGQVLVNDAEFSVESPFGGWKHSGFGRELGPEALHEFTELTTVQR